MGTLFRARLLPFLRADTILSGGSQVSTEQFARFMAKGFYVAGALTIVLGGVALLSLLAAKRRRMRKYGLSENRVGPHF